MEGNTYRFSCWKIHETENAILVADMMSGEELWIPLSQVESLHFDKKGEGTLVISEWIARKKGIF